MSQVFVTDSYYCSICDVWTENPCGCPQSECEFTGRPDKPSQVVEMSMSEIKESGLDFSNEDLKLLRKRT